MKKALTIAGFDPSGGAGLQADLKVFHALGIYGLSAVAALTAQNSMGVEHVMPVDPLFLKKQIAVLCRDMVPDAVKIGMLLTEANVLTVSSLIRRFGLKNIVLDPVFISSSGRRLAERPVPCALREKLFSLCSIITPNIHEASVLSGIRIKSEKDSEKAAVLLRGLGPETVIITGGHSDNIAMDVVYDGSFHYLKARKRQGEFHGTGCIFSAAIAAFLARGFDRIEASKRAKQFMLEAFRSTISTGRGMKLFTI